VRANVSPVPDAPHWNRIIRALPDPAPLVSIIVPTRDHAELLERCAASVLACTDYPAIELLIVDNNTSEQAAVNLLHRLSQHPRVRVLPYPQPFNFAAQNNMAAREAHGEILVLLNNDTEAMRPGWLREMVTHAVRPDVGAVGAKLLYPDKLVQHGGMTLGPTPWPQHQLRYANYDDTGPFGELALTRTVSVVTGACLAVRRSVFFEVGGFDEQLKIAFNDVDLCLRIGDFGYRIVFTPFAELLHYGTASLEADGSPEMIAIIAQELQHFWRRWRSLCNQDPFHNPNIEYGWGTLNLSWPPRRARPWLACPS
jgi:GT2 family glycosyltransferase